MLLSTRAIMWPSGLETTNNSRINAMHEKILSTLQQEKIDDDFEPSMYGHMIGKRLAELV